MIHLLLILLFSVALSASENSQTSACKIPVATFIAGAFAHGESLKIPYGIMAHAIEEYGSKADLLTLAAFYAECSNDNTVPAVFMLDALFNLLPRVERRYNTRVARTRLDEPSDLMTSIIDKYVAKDTAFTSSQAFYTLMKKMNIPHKDTISFMRSFAHSFLETSHNNSVSAQSDLHQHSHRASRLPEGFPHSYTPSVCSLAVAVSYINNKMGLPVPMDFASKAPESAIRSLGRDFGKTLKLMQERGMFVELFQEKDSQDFCLRVVNQI